MFDHLSTEMLKRVESEMLDALFGPGYTTNKSTTTKAPPLTAEALLKTWRDVEKQALISGIVEWAKQTIPEALEGLAKEGRKAEDVERWMIVLPETIGFKDGDTETTKAGEWMLEIRCSKYTPDNVFLVPQMKLLSMFKFEPYDFYLKTAAAPSGPDKEEQSI